MSIREFLHRSWIQKVQGEYVLPIARVAYLLIAGISLLAAVLGLAAVIFFQVSASRSTSARPVADVAPPASITINLKTISDSFLPPTNIRAIPLPFIRPATLDTPLVYLDAQSPHGLSPYPDDFFVLGGPDAQYFERESINVGGVLHTGFKPTAPLLEQINGVHPTREFTIRVAAKDASGSVSQPVNLRFTLRPSAAPPQQAVQGPPPATALETLARRIALFVDPTRSPVYFDAYQTALHEPDRCRTSSDDANFVSEYARAFDYMQSSLKKDALDNFYSELCNAWASGVRAQQFGIEQAEAAHNQAISQSLGDQMAAEAEVIASRIARNAALMFVAAAISIFLFLSLFLAFLAMENHSKAMREILAAIAVREKK